MLEVEGVRGHDQKLMIEDFERQHSLRPEKKQACFHGILSFYPGEKPSDSQIREITGKYLEALNIRDTQFAIMKHTDKEHLHVHLIANMVNNKGKSISDNWIALRGKKQAQRLTKEYHLTQSLSKDLSRTHYQSLREPEQHQYKIYAAIKHHLRESRSMDDLEERLRRLGIEIQYKMRGQTQERQGVSFRLGEYRFKGSKIDRQYSYGNLNKTIERQKMQMLMVSPEQNPYKQNLKVERSDFKEKAVNISRTVTREMTKALEQLMKQEQSLEQMPYELSQEAEKKRHRYRQQQFGHEH